MATTLFKNRSLVWLLLACLILSATSAVQAKSQSSEEAAGFIPGTSVNPENQELTTFTANFTDLGAGEIILRGVFPSHTLFVPLPESWQVQSANLHLNISHAKVLRNNSTLTIEVNGVPIYSQVLDYANSEGFSVDIAIPAELLQTFATTTGLTIRFIGYMRINDEDICEDIQNPANWTRISANSALSLRYTPANFLPELSRFPYPFIDVRSPTLDDLVISLPANSSGSELAAAVNIAGFFGTEATWRGVNIFYSNLDKLTEDIYQKYDLIMVGKKDQLPVLQTLKNELPLNLDGLKEKTGAVMQFASPWNPVKSLLIVTGKTDQAVSNAGLALVNPAFPALARGSYSLIPEAPVDLSQTQQAVNWGNLSLADLGYTDLSVFGIGKHTLRYNIYLPASAQPQSVKVKVVLSHAPFVTTDQSYVTIWVNHQPVSGKYLGIENEQRGVWEVSIPSENLDPGLNLLDVIFDLELKDEAACDDYYFDKAWGVIHAESSLQVKFDDAVIEPKMENFPIPFGEQTLVITPVNPNEYEKAAAFQLMNALGASLGKQARNIAVLPANLVTTEQAKNNHLIIIGQPHHNPYVPQALQSATVKFDTNYRKIQSSLVKLTVVDAQMVGIVEMLPSFWNVERTAMVISGTNEYSVGWASNLLKDKTNRARLKGNVALVDANGNLTTFSSTKLQAAPGVEPLTPRRDFPVHVLIYAAVALLGVFAIVLLVVVIRRWVTNKSRKKEQPK